MKPKPIPKWEEEINTANILNALPRGFHVDIHGPPQAWWACELPTHGKPEWNTISNSLFYKRDFGDYLCWGDACKNGAKGLNPGFISDRDR